MRIGVCSLVDVVRNFKLLLMLLAALLIDTGSAWADSLSCERSVKAMDSRDIFRVTLYAPHHHCG